MIRTVAVIASAIVVIPKPAESSHYEYEIDPFSRGPRQVYLNSTNRIVGEPFPVIDPKTERKNVSVSAKKLGPTITHACTEAA